MNENIEKHIIIGLIFSEPFLSQINDFFDERYIESAAMRKVAQWALKHYSEHNSAPGKHIETIFYDELNNNNIEEGLAKIIEKFTLSVIQAGNEEADIDPDFLLKQTQKYFTERHAQLHSEKVTTLFENDKIEKATELQNSYQPLEFVDNVDFPDAKAVDEMNLTVPKQILSPWLREGEFNLIYADVGVGKSLLAMLIGYICGMKQYSDVNLGDWYVRKRTGCLLVDGELGYYGLKNERYDSFTHLGEQAHAYRMKFYSIADESLKYQKSLTMEKRENQKLIIDFFKIREKYKLLILDNVSTVFGLEDENSNSEWNNKINPFLRDLRSLGIAVVILDHSGKDKKKGQRGSSAKTAMMSNVFSLTDHDEKRSGEAWFNINKPSKQRAAGTGIEPFNIRFNLIEDPVSGKRETNWEIDVT